MTATPETFKPGERWLMRDVKLTLHDMTCLEWSPTLCFVRVFWNLERVWVGAHSLSSLEMVERLPDESGNHKTESARGTEAHCGQCACCRWEIEQHRNELTPQEVWQRHEYAAEKIKEYAESINNETR